MTTDTRQTATHPTGADLKPFGYAPGGYMVRCRHCDAIRADLDKRAWSCRSCAVEQWQARQSAPPTQTAQPLPAAIETDIGDLYALCKATEIATAWGIAASLRAAITTALSAARQEGWLAGREAERERWLACELVRGEPPQHAGWRITGLNELASDLRPNLFLPPMTEEERERAREMLRSLTLKEPTNG